MLKKRLEVLDEFHKDCVSKLPGNALVLSSADLFMQPLVKELIEDTPNDGPEFTLSNLDPVKDSFLEISREWIEEVKSELFAMVKAEVYIPSNGEHEDDIDTHLELATTFFHCSGCSEDSYRGSPGTLFRYKRAIAHACTGEWDPGTELPETETLETLRENLKKLPWNADDRISFNSRAHYTMRDMIALCDLDPDTTTAKEMNALDPIFECLTCNSQSNGRCIMTWECVVQHEQDNGPHGEPMRETNNKCEAKFVLLDEEEANVVRQRMAEELARERASDGYRGLCCPACRLQGNSVNLADESHKCWNMGTINKVIPCIDHRQYPVEYWLWPPRNQVPLDIESTEID
ncbi:hypothetical protein M413DRAFT_274628 [Hebeloma cylindrosporum]|uniref:Uncharacterized protein n=1 Tax=Hebeloma cylindrosporum TaxID=76867 RepID=A0A0C2Y8T6_HEBCY|nr:hypothetical protein M413DRAFT_274628 [Hebeloma cylindrosporum h7]